MMNGRKLLFLLLSFFFSIRAGAQNEQVFSVTNETFEILEKVTQSPLSNGAVLLSLTTHQDLVWIDEIEKCVVMRDTQWLTPFMQRLEDEPGFEMDVEQASIIQEYIGRHPDKKEEIIQRLKEGRMLIGATYTQPYEEMFFSESLARQFYLGKRWLKKEFGGYNATSYYNSDVPGRSLQMPQLLAKAGVENMFISRHERGVFDWLSPDGSKVTTYSPGHYIDFYTILGKEREEALKELANQALIWSDGYNDIPGEEAVMPAVLNFEFIWDPRPVENLDPFMAFWNNLKTVRNEDGETLNVSLPEIRFSTLDKFFEGLRKSTQNFPSIMGERPNVWIYIHGPSHHWALDHSRQAGILLPVAEKFAAADALVSGSYAKYPAKQFNIAWESKIYPDHGWGGKGGQSTDDIFLMRFADAHEKAKNLVCQSVSSLASKVNPDASKGIPVVVFNSLNWQRTSPVKYEMNFDPGKARAVRVYNAQKQQIPAQIACAVRDDRGFLKSAEIHFVAEDVPSMGYDTYYLDYSQEEPPRAEEPFNPFFENDFYAVEFSDGGLSRLYDKQLGEELIDASFFKAGEIFTMKSEGNGAGEFDAVQQPTMEGFDKTGNYSTDWEVTASGPVFRAFKFRQPIRNSVAELEVVFYENLKKIDFEVAVKNWDGTMFREYRMALPLKMEGGQVAYEVPYGVVEVGKDEMPGAAGERYQELCSETRPRGIENWISASGEKAGVTLASSVVGMDYKDPTGENSNGIVLQPVLLASRRSCHGQGNDYHQTGHHHFSFSITSHTPGWKNGANFGKQANELLVPVFDPPTIRGADLPEESSFLKTDHDNIVVTAMKKAEDREGIVIRLFNRGEEPFTGNLTLWKPFESAYVTNLIEEDQKQLKLEGKKLRLDMEKYEIKTVRLE